MAINHGGRRANSGRKSKAKELGLAEILDRIWTLGDRYEVIQALNEKAKAGNEKAAALLLAYAYGKPTERVEHSNPDGSPLLSPVADAIAKIYGANPNNK